MLILPHIRRRLDTRHKLQPNISQSHERKEGTRRVLPPTIAHNNATNEDVEDAAADEGEHEAGVTRDLGRGSGIRGGRLLQMRVLVWTVGVWVEGDVQRPNIIT